MPVTMKSPGVYIQELPSAVRPIVGVATSVAAFVGAAPRGRTDDPFQCNSWSDYEREFGDLDHANYPLSSAVYLFFLNGGSTALVVRNSDPAQQAASTQLSKDITLLASSPGDWGADLIATVDTDNLLEPKAGRFNLTIEEKAGASESYTGVNLTQGDPLYLPTALAASQLVVPAEDNKYETPPTPKDYEFKLPAAGDGGPPAADTPPLPLGDEDAKTGIYALGKADIFNILCLPVDPSETLDPATILAPAVEFCTDHRAMLLVDPPSAWSAATPLDFETATGKPALNATSANAAVYYPNLVIRDRSGSHTISPCGAIAGVWAATDTNRGVWKAPAGTEARINGISDLAAHVDEGESGVLNPIAINALRTFPSLGPVVWGARTTVGADQFGDQWKYVPVRRTALFIEESLRRGTQWVVFEPNDEPLWASIRLNVGTFMNGLFRAGAFQGSTPAEAYLVKCDKDNNPQGDIDLGIVNILVGFAPLKPAEFVLIKIQQLAGQAQT